MKKNSRHNKREKDRREPAMVFPAAALPAKSSHSSHCAASRERCPSSKGDNATAHQPRQARAARVPLASLSLFCPTNRAESEDPGLSKCGVKVRGIFRVLRFRVQKRRSVSSLRAWPSLACSPFRGYNVKVERLDVRGEELGGSGVEFGMDAPPPHAPSTNLPSRFIDGRCPSVSVTIRANAYWCSVPSCC
jgi:hypothetical protein